MPRNQFPGPCYRCGTNVAVGDGHFERLGYKWRVQHATCAIEFRGILDPARDRMRFKIEIDRAQGTGKRAQRARRAIRDRLKEKNNDG